MFLHVPQKWKSLASYAFQENWKMCHHLVKKKPVCKSLTKSIFNSSSSRVRSHVIYQFTFTKTSLSRVSRVLAVNYGPFSFSMSLQHLLQETQNKLTFSSKKKKHKRGSVLKVNTHKKPIWLHWLHVSIQYKYWWVWLVAQ